MSDFSYLKGVYNIVPTPWNADGSLDIPGIKRLTDFVIQSGVHGMTILGVMGEGAKLSDIERERAVAEFVKASDGRVPICVGTSHDATDRCIAFSRQAELLGAKAVMVAAPRLARPTNDAALRKHFLAVAESVSLPIVVQDHPSSVGVYMSAEWIAALAKEAPMCRWVKLEDEPSPPKIARLRALNSDLIVFGGLGGYMFLEELKRGAIGTMTGFGFPEILVEIYQKFTAGDLDGATAVFDRYMPLIRFENQPLINLPIRKQIYCWRGALATANLRAPSAALDAGTLEDLKGILKRLNLLDVK
jgi:4-hydroxy-tetrahydrodipicolinate synthase